MSNLSFSTRAIHADAAFHEANGEVAPSINVTTTFRHGPHDNDWPLVRPSDDAFVYSRDTQPLRTRLETVLSALEGGESITYSSGLTAIYAIMNYVCPKRIIKTATGYFGCENAAKSWAKGRTVVCSSQLPTNNARSFCI